MGVAVAGTRAVQVSDVPSAEDRRMGFCLLGEAMTSGRSVAMARRKNCLPRL
jgi:hypothetical protein